MGCIHAIEVAMAIDKMNLRLAEPPKNFQYPPGSLATVLDKNQVCTQHYPFEDYRYFEHAEAKGEYVVRAYAIWCVKCEAYIERGLLYDKVTK